MKIDSIEIEIVTSFFAKNRQERILWELSNPKKRDSVFWRLAGPDDFKSECLQLLPRMSDDAIEKYLFRLGNNKDVYYFGESCIRSLPLSEAIKNVLYGEMCIIYFGNGIGFYQAELDYASAPKYLLKKTD